MSRAYNRDQSKKALKRAKKVVTIGWNIDERKEPKAVDKLAHRLRDNPKKCSCDMCRNPRRSGYNKGVDKLTMQERRAAGKATSPAP